MADAPQSPRAGMPDDDRTLLLRMLYDEQARLRNEVESLRDKGAAGDSKSGGKGDDKQQGGGKDNSGGSDSEGKDDKDVGDEESGGKDDDKQKKAEEKRREKQTPLIERMRASAVEHPVATVLGIAGAILLIVVIVLLLIYLSSYEDTDDAFIDGHTDPISARISGYIVKINVENTNRVKKGDLLVVLDPRDNQVAKEQAYANYSQAMAAVRAQEPNVPITATDQTTQAINDNLNVVSARANVAATDERYQSALADLRQAQADAENAAREEIRYRLLVEKEEVSREIYDQKATQARAQAEVVASRKKTADAAQKAVVQAEAQLNMARARAEQQIQDTPKQIKIQRETLAQRQADAQTALAQANQAELNLEYTRIYAPEDGIIGDKQAQLAEQVAPGQELFALTQTNDIWITANFKETAIRKMRPGQSVDIHVDALDEDFKGYVEALPGASGAIYSLIPPENATGNYVKVVQRLPVRIRIRPGQRDAGRLAPGMSVEPKVWLR